MLNKQFNKSNGVGCGQLHESVLLGCLSMEKLKVIFCFKKYIVTLCAHIFFYWSKGRAFSLLGRTLLLRETGPEQERINVNKQKTGP